GMHAQKQLGFSYVGANVLSGRITPEQLRLAADLSDQYGDGHIRNTVMQNLVIVNIPDRNAIRVAGELTAAGLPVRAAAFARAAVACTGTEFCKLTPISTKSFPPCLLNQTKQHIPRLHDL